MSIFKRTLELTEEERQQVADMCGKIFLWILEGRSLDYMSEQLNLTKEEVLRNIDEMQYTLRWQVTFL